MFSERKRKQLLVHISELESQLIELTTVLVSKGQQPSDSELEAIRTSLLIKSDRVLSTLHSCLIEQI